ncbi:MAG TPA: Gfo/Idh/MocA family oxidoreductase [Acidobacteriota bacterium]|jgi:predicted dehydrogenase
MIPVPLFLVLSLLLLVGGPAPQTAAGAPLKIGIIGTDTSHVIAFTQLLNDSSRPDYIPGARVVAAFKGGSPDVESSRTRIERFAAELKDRWKVEFVDSIEGLCNKVDAVLLESVDGRPHLAQVRPVLAAKRRVFIDKPMAGSLRDAREILRLSRQYGTPFFSASSRRFVPEVQALKNDPRVGEVLGASTYGPSPLEPHHPDLFWYGIHSVETLYALMGTGCETVMRANTDGADVLVGKWKDGRLGVVRGIRKGAESYGAIVFGSKAVVAADPPGRGSDYRNLVMEIVKFFQTGVPPVSPEETLEILAFMEAADLSKTRNGAAVSLSELQ